MKLIGICGKARSGKDTAAAYLAKKLNLHQYSLAAPLKDMLTTVFGNHFYDGNRERICPETGVSYRVMMQTLGTEWGRGLNPNIWVNLVNRRWEEVKSGKHFGIGTSRAQGMVLSDIRFDSEAEWVLNQGGFLIEVTRANADQIQGIANHASEAGISNHLRRYMVDNSRELKDLYWQLDQIVSLA